jgi:hypothetical protein
MNVSLETDMAREVSPNCFPAGLWPDLRVRPKADCKEARLRFDRFHGHIAFHYGVLTILARHVQAGRMYCQLFWVSMLLGPLASQAA